MAAVCLGFAILLYSRWDVMPAWQKAVAALAYLTPVIVGYGTWLVPPILLVGLLVQGQWLDGVRLTVDIGGPGHRRLHFALRPTRDKLAAHALDPFDLASRAQRPTERKQPEIPR